METLANLELAVIRQTAEPDPDPNYQEAYDAIAEMAAETINYEEDD